MSVDNSTDWFIRAIADGDPAIQDDTANAVAVQLGIKPEATYFCVVVEGAAAFPLAENVQFPSQLLSACTQIGRTIPGFLHAFISDKLCIVMVFHSLLTRDAVVQRLEGALARRVQVKLRIGVGKAYPQLKKLSYSKVDAYEALAALPGGCTISYIDDIYYSRSFTTRKLEGEKRRIIDLFRAGRFQEMMDSLADLSEQIRAETPVRDGMPYPSSIRRTVVELLVEILHIGSDAGVDVEKLLDHQDPYTRVFELVGTPAILSWFRDVATVIHDGIHEISLKSDGNMLVLAKKFIGEHIHDPDLSLQLVSEKLGITPGYFSAFFIREMDMGFNEYITGIRLEHAKILLKEPGKKIHEIALECGFQSASYFIFVFRKKTGMSPGNYRKQNLRSL